MKDVGEITGYDYSGNASADVESVDGKYGVHFDIKDVKDITVSQKLPLDKFSQKDQEKVLQELKKLYPNKTYALDKEIIMYRPYDSEKGKFIDHITNEIKGKNFIVNLTRNGFSEDKTLRVTQAIIEFDVNEIEPKVLKTAEEAMKMVLNQDANFKGATLSIDGWFLADGDAFVEMDPKSNKVTSVIDMARKKERVTSDKGMTAKEAKEVVAPLAKKFFDIDLTGYEAKWDDKSKNYSFF